ncbi:MAG: enoyl-CoA hydratase/isomerase family protein [Betaproteobacteria bacterium]|nr:enoyl-CoA hydratase/isomerase family protein [Betaproteobacteria bacterium]
MNLVEIDREGSAAVVTLKRLERLNALGHELVSELIGALDILDVDEAVRGVVITGSERAFSAGGDLNETIEVDTVVKSLRYLARMRRLTATIEDLSKPVVAAIRGFCYTGGLEIALACDRRIAARDAQFSVSSARMGSVAGLGGTQQLPRIAGSAIAKDILLTSRVFGGVEAGRWGVVDEVVPAEETVQRAVSWVEMVAQSAPVAVWLNKIAVNVGPGMDLASSLQFEGLLNALAFTTEDRREGMSAILAKRPATFKGR